MKNFVKPDSLEEALEYLNSSQCTILAGGTDLMVEFHKGEDLGDSIVDISSLKELKGITSSEDSVRIYSGSSHSEIEKSEIIKEKLLKSDDFYSKMEILRLKSSIPLHMKLVKEFWKQ